MNEMILTDKELLEEAFIALSGICFEVKRQSGKEWKRVDELYNSIAERVTLTPQGMDVQSKGSR